jgi:hypothetical protein
MTEHEHNDPQPCPKATPPKARLADNIRSVVVTGLISASLLTVMYGVTLHRADEQRAQHQAELQHEAAIEAAQPST